MTEIWVSSPLERAVLRIIAGRILTPEEVADILIEESDILRSAPAAYRAGLRNTAAVALHALGRRGLAVQIGRRWSADASVRVSGHGGCEGWAPALLRKQAAQEHASWLVLQALASDAQYPMSGRKISEISGLDGRRVDGAARRLTAQGLVVRTDRGCWPYYRITAAGMASLRHDGDDDA